MNIIEAVKSGRPFKRPMEDHYWELIEKDGVQFLAYGPEKKLEAWTACFMTADDWELEPEQELTLTKTKVTQAIVEAVKEKFAERKIQFYPTLEMTATECILDAITPVIKKLGFK